MGDMHSGKRASEWPTMNKLIPLTVCLLLSTYTFAQKLPNPTRTVYKCGVGDKVQYSDSPCLGATKVDVEPTRGLDTSSGRTRVGKDVQREQFNESFAEAVRPLTGMDAKQLDALGQRMKLSPELQRRCKVLDQEIPRAELAERQAEKGDALNAVQALLYKLRSAYRQSGC